MESPPLFSDPILIRTTYRKPFKNKIRFKMSKEIAKHCRKMYKKSPSPPRRTDVVSPSPPHRTDVVSPSPPHRTDVVSPSPPHQADVVSPPHRTDVVSPSPPRADVVSPPHRADVVSPSPPHRPFSVVVTSPPRHRADPPPATSSIPSSPSHRYRHRCRRQVYRHERVEAVLAIERGGFTFCTGVESVVHEGPLSHSRIVRELVRLKIRNLWLVSKKNNKNNTGRTWKDVSATYRHLFPPKLKVFVMEPFPIKNCFFCQKTRCHVFAAAAGWSHLKKTPFDPVDHCRPPPSAMDRR